MKRNILKLEMRIALLLPQPPGYSETFFRSKIKGLIDNGHQLVLVTAATNKTFDLCEHIQHPKVYKNPIRQLLSMLLVFIGLLSYWTKVNRYINLEQKEGTSFKRLVEKIYINASLLKLNADWIHFGFATMALDRETVPKAIGAKLAVSFRGYDIGVYPLDKPNCYSKLCKWVSKVHYISDDLYHKALNIGLSSSIPAQKIPPAINTNLFQSTKPNATSSKPSFLTIGRLHWKKGFVEMLKALAELKTNGIDFQYKIIGEGNDYERIAYAAYRLGIQDKVEFLGKLEHEEVISRLQETDYYLQYSIQEGFCNAVLEAQAMGKLCIVSDAEGLSENVLDHQTGWVVPRGQSHLLAQKILEVMQKSNQQKEQISQKAIQRVHGHFSLEQQKQEFNLFYKY
jgi:colanic acid/amylovoran biosynthesis glycosyltransferase